MNKEKKYLLVLEDIEGLKVENGKVFPSLSLLLTDNNGNILISNPNLYSNMTNGLDAKGFTNGQMPITLTFADGQSFNPYKLMVVLKDTKSDNELNISTKLEIE